MDFEFSLIVLGCLLASAVLTLLIAICIEKVK